MSVRTVSVTFASRDALPALLSEWEGELVITEHPDGTATATLPLYVYSAQERADIIAEARNNNSTAPLPTMEDALDPAAFMRWMMRHALY